MLRKEGDMVDCNVAGSSNRSADDPKFALLVYFRKLVFEVIRDLVNESD